MTNPALLIQNEIAERITVRGLVQGVGFRPTVWRLAHEHALRGWVTNNGTGVEIYACGDPANLEQFIADLTLKAPPLARVDAVARDAADVLPLEKRFRITDSVVSSVHTGVVPDAIICESCRAEIFDPYARRYRYPFTNCTHCGPRLSIIQGIPYDRHQTTMAGFAMCEDCRSEYNDPHNRRFHAQPIACYACGPRAWIERADGKPLVTSDKICLTLTTGECDKDNNFGYQCVCVYTQGYWKNHSSNWPVCSLTLGGKCYSKCTLLNLLGTSTTTDKTLIIARQLIAAVRFNRFEKPEANSRDLRHLVPRESTFLARIAQQRPKVVGRPCLHILVSSPIPPTEF